MRVALSAGVWKRSSTMMVLNGASSAGVMVVLVMSMLGAVHLLEC